MQSLLRLYYCYTEHCMYVTYHRVCHAKCRYMGIVWSLAFDSIHGWGMFKLWISNLWGVRPGNPRVGQAEQMEEGAVGLNCKSYKVLSILF